jgi:hypothetical protein
MLVFQKDWGLLSLAVTQKGRTKNQKKHLVYNEIISICTSIYKESVIIQMNSNVIFKKYQ